MEAWYIRIDDHMSVAGEVPMDEEQPRHFVSVAGSIMDDRGRFLVIRRRDNGHWELPGGILELQETIHEGLVREVKEETGLLVEPIAQSGIYKNMKRGIVALVFRCRVIEGQARPTAEASEFRWMTPAEVSDFLDEAYACRLLDSLDTDSPAIRSHDGATLIANR